MSAAARENPWHIEARKLVQGALETLDRITRPDGIPLGEHVPRQAARALRSAADLLDPVHVVQSAFEPPNTVPYFSESKFEGFVSVGALQHAGLPYPACCYPETAEARTLEAEADALREERKHAEGI